VSQMTMGADGEEACVWEPVKTIDIPSSASFVDCESIDYLFYSIWQEMNKRLFLELNHK